MGEEEAQQSAGEVVSARDSSFKEMPVGSFTADALQRRGRRVPRGRKKREWEDGRAVAGGDDTRGAGGRCESHASTYRLRNVRTI